MYSALKSGEVDIAVGTHALFSKGVEFNRLGLIITDEQHRFGVAQRAELLEKGESPHLLVMSATPIPRTLALMIFGDLDLSILDELPPGRQKISTYLIDSTIRPRALNFMKSISIMAINAILFVRLLRKMIPIWQALRNMLKD